MYIVTFVPNTPSVGAASHASDKFDCEELISEFCEKFNAPANGRVLVFLEEHSVSWTTRPTLIED